MPLIQNQLAEHADHICEPLGLQGARGVLKIALVSHGCVFVKKGTVPAFMPDLFHEEYIYERLKALQGATIPVCLGDIRLNKIYYLDLRIRISHMLVLSWASTLVIENGFTNKRL